MKAINLTAFALVVAMTTAASALATGGSSIAKAPMVTSGAKATEDTGTEATGQGGESVGQGCFISVEYFRLSLKAGDKVQIKGAEIGAAHDFELAVFPPKTTDKTIATSTSVAFGYPARHVMNFKAKLAGVYVIVAGPTCYDGTQGQFAFTPTVTHTK
jgi:hypothetical protein